MGVELKPIGIQFSKSSENYCSNRIDSCGNALTYKINQIHSKRKLALVTVPYLLAVTALGLAKIATPLFDAFIHLGQQMRKPLNESRVRIGLLFPVQLGAKIVDSARNALLAPCVPIFATLNLHYQFRSMKKAAEI